MEAIDYLWGMGMTVEMTSDKRYYTEILLKRVCKSIIRKFQKIHGGTFDYSRVDYYNHTTKIIIICRRHGPFEQQPRLHLRGSTGCRQCIAERGK